MPTRAEAQQTESNPDKLMLYHNDELSCWHHPYHLCAQEKPSEAYAQSSLAAARTQQLEGTPAKAANDTPASQSHTTSLPSPVPAPTPTPVPPTEPPSLPPRSAPANPVLCLVPYKQDSPAMLLKIPQVFKLFCCPSLTTVQKTPAMQWGICDLAGQRLGEPRRQIRRQSWRPCTRSCSRR